MSRDYKPGPERTKNNNKGNPFLTGLLIGFLLGVAASLSVVMFIKGGQSPFENKKNVSARDLTIENTDALPTTEKPVKGQDKTRFDFYTILPGSESQVSAEEESKLKEEPAPAEKNSYFLQVGAFQTETEADNMKAQLALQGFEAQVQTATIPEKGVWHRVRVGPLNDLDQINKTKTELATNGFQADLIKVNTNNQ